MSEKKVSRRNFVKYAGAGAAVVAAAAAGAYYLTTPPPAPPTPTTTTAVETTPPPSPVTLELWTSFAGEKPQEEFFDVFRETVSKQYPHVSLKVTHYTGTDFLPKLTAAMGAGSPPDLFVSYGGGQLKALVDEGQTEDMTAFLSEGWAAALIPESAKSSHTFRGKTYALPYELNTCWLLANKNVFKAAGVEVPTKTWNWDEFMGVTQAFKSKGKYALTISGNAPRHMVYHLDYLMERIAGQDRFLKTLNREAGHSFADQPFVDAFKKFAELVAAGAFFPGASAYKYGDIMKSLGMGEAAMLCIYTWVVAPIMKDFPDAELDILPYPTVPGGAGGPDIAAYTLGMAMAKASKNKGDAYNVLRIFAWRETMLEYAKKTGNPIALNLGAMPAGTLNPVSQKAEDLARASTKFVYRKATLMPPELGSKYEEVVSKVFFNTMTPEEATAALEAKAEELKDLGILPM